MCVRKIYFGAGAGAGGGVTITVVLSAGLPVSPFIPSLPVLPVAPCGPAGPGTATGVAGTFTTVGLSQAARLNVASTAEINMELFMVNPLEI